MRTAALLTLVLFTGCAHRERVAEDVELSELRGAYARTDAGELAALDRRLLLHLDQEIAESEREVRHASAKRHQLTRLRELHQRLAGLVGLRDASSVEQKQVLLEQLANAR